MGSVPMLSAKSMCNAWTIDYFFKFFLNTHVAAYKFREQGKTYLAKAASCLRAYCSH